MNIIDNTIRNAIKITGAIKDTKRRIISSRSKVGEMTPEEKAEMIKLFKDHGVENSEIRKIVNKDKVYYTAVDIKPYYHTETHRGCDRAKGGDYGDDLWDEFSLKGKRVTFNVMHNGNILNLHSLSVERKFVGTYGYSRFGNADIDTRHSGNPGTPYLPLPCQENSLIFSGNDERPLPMPNDIDMTDINVIRYYASDRDIAYFLDKFFIVTPEERKKYNEFAQATDLRNSQEMKKYVEEIEFRAGFRCNGKD